MLPLDAAETNVQENSIFDASRESSMWNHFLPLPPSVIQLGLILSFVNIKKNKHETSKGKKDIIGATSTDKSINQFVLEK